jgi:heptosyltransferase II
MESILIIRFSSLGDVVLATAAVDAVLSSFPDCRITVLTKRSYEPVFAGDRRIHRVVGAMEGESPREIADKTGRRFDALADLHCSLRSLLVGALIHSKVRARVDKQILARRLMVWSRNRFRRRFDVLGSYMEALGRLGIHGRALPKIVPLPHSLGDADHLLDPLRKVSGRLIGLAPGARHLSKRWSAPSWARLAEHLAGRGDAPVFIGDSGDEAFIGEVRSLAEVEVPSLAESSDLAAAIGIVARLDGIVCNDSGPMHLAGALGTPFAAIFGPTHPDLGFAPGYPYGAVLHAGLPCSPCSLHGESPCRLGDRRCMDAVETGTVIRELDRVIGLKAGESSQPSPRTMP